jgi:HSP20 family protein
LRSPRADVFEQNGAIVVAVELPGVKKEDIDVAVENGDLVIRGARSSDEAINEKDYYWTERFQGSFYRWLPLPAGVSAEQISATYEDGVLTVTVPKPIAETPTATRIPVH